MSERYSIIDSHCHLDRFFHNGELETVIEEARNSGVDRMITIGTCEDDWHLYRNLAEGYPGIIDFTVGLHPGNVDESWERQVAQLKRFFRDEKIRPVGLGEIGLDHFHLPKKDLQKAKQICDLQVRAFRAQLALAREWDCPVVIHSRGALQECIQELDTSEVNWSKVVFHCFVENATAIGEINDRGGRGSFTGIVTFKNAGDVRDAAVAQGLERFMVETDAPYLAPEPYRGKRCYPSYTALTARYCAGLFGIPENTLAKISRENTEAFFGLE